MNKRSKTEQEERGGQDELTALIRTGAQKLIAQALKVEVAELLATYADQQDEQGHARVVRINADLSTRLTQSYTRK